MAELQQKSTPENEREPDRNMETPQEMQVSFRRRVYDMLESGDVFGRRGSYDIFMIIVIVLSLLPLMFHDEGPFLTFLDYATVTIFIIDYALRWMTADYKFGSRSISSFLYYPFTFMAVIDLISILPSLILISKAFKALRIIRMLRAFRAFRALRIFRYSAGMLLIVEVLRSSRRPMAAVFNLVIAYIVICALIMFNVEPESFDSFYDAIYWSLISLTTIGYGDYYPVSEIGKFVTMASALFGLVVIALPAGIVTAEFMKELEGRKDVKHNMIYTELTKKAMRIAYTAHHGQLDKAGLPYISHPLHVAEQMPDEVTTCVALLHDVVEDTDVTLEDLAREFPPEVVHGVALMTHREGVPYLEYVRELSKDPVAHTVKLADLEHNMDETRRPPDMPEAERERLRNKYAAALAILHGDEQETVFDQN